MHLESGWMVMAVSVAHDLKQTIVMLRLASLILRHDGGAGFVGRQREFTKAAAGPKPSQRMSLAIFISEANEGS